MIRQKHSDPDLLRCEHCGTGPVCVACGRGCPPAPPRMVRVDRRATLFMGLRWEVFRPRSGRVIARCQSKAMAAALAFLFGADYAPSGMGY